MAGNSRSWGASLSPQRREAAARHLANVLRRQSAELGESESERVSDVLGSEPGALAKQFEAAPAAEGEEADFTGRARDYYSAELVTNVTMVPIASRESSEVTREDLPGTLGLHAKVGDALLSDHETVCVALPLLFTSGEYGHQENRRIYRSQVSDVGAHEADRG